MKIKWLLFLFLILFHQTHPNSANQYLFNSKLEGLKERLSEISGNNSSEVIMPRRSLKRGSGGRRFGGRAAVGASTGGHRSGASSHVSSTSVQVVLGFLALLQPFL